MENNHFNVAWEKSTALYTKAASVLGIGYPEMMVLYALESMGELTQKQIAEMKAELAELKRQKADRH